MIKLALYSVVQHWLQPHWSGYLFQSRQCDDITGCFTGTIPGAEGEGEAWGGGSEGEGGPGGILL